MLTALLLTAAPFLQGVAAEPAAPSPYLKAAKENRRVLIRLAQDDAEVTAALDGLLHDRGIGRILLYEYVQHEAREPRHPDPQEAVVLRIHDAQAQPLAAITLADLRDVEGKLSTQRLASLLKEHQAEPWDALEVLESARKRAVAGKKRLLVNLGAPW